MTHMSEPTAARDLELTYPEAAEFAFRLHTQRRYQEAETIYRELLKANPDDQNVIHYLGVLMFQSGRGSEAAKLIQRSLELDDTVAAWHNNYGNVLLQADRFENHSAIDVQRSQLVAQIDDVPVEGLEIHAIGCQRLDDQTLRAREESPRLGGGRDDTHVRGQLRHQRERETASHTVHARNHQPNNRRSPADAWRTNKAPRGTREEDVEPALPKGYSTRRDRCLKPAVPDVDERVRDAPPEEIAVTRQLAVEAHFHLASHGIRIRS